MAQKDGLSPEQEARVGEVFSTHQRLIERVASRYTSSQDHVPDIVQEVGVKLCQNLHAFRNESELETWIYRITINAANNYFRRENRHQRIAQRAIEQPHEVIDPDDELISGQRMEALADALERIRPQDRRLICNELQADGVLHGDRTARHRARRQLREQLSDDPRLDS